MSLGGIVAMAAFCGIFVTIYSGWKWGLSAFFLFLVVPLAIVGFEALLQKRKDQ